MHEKFSKIYFFSLILYSRNQRFSRVSLYFFFIFSYTFFFHPQFFLQKGSLVWKETFNWVIINNLKWNWDGFSDFWFGVGAKRRREKSTSRRRKKIWVRASKYKYILVYYLTLPEKNTFLKIWILSRIFLRIHEYRNIFNEIFN